MLIIAHRGASGYLPEHSLESKALAFGLNANFIEQDLIMTKDDQLIVFHDLYLNNTTNIEEIFPERKRSDGKYYIIDFTYKELQKLQLSERFEINNGKKTAKYLNRFPIFKSNFKIHKFEDEIEMIQGLNKSMNKNIGIYPEIKYPEFHNKAGKDISRRTLEILKKYYYRSKDSNIFLQSFCSEELKRIKNKLFIEFEMDLKIVQLIEDENPINLKEIIKYADAIGISLKSIFDQNSTCNNLIKTNIVAIANEYGLQTHIYTLRKDNLPPFAKDYQDLLKILKKQKIDAIFTDFP